MTDEMSSDEAERLVIKAARRTACQMYDSPAPTVDADVDELCKAIEIVNTNS